MFSYLLFNFLIYSLLGFIIEQFYALFSRGHFKSEGFLYGPFKPMYGFAMTFLVYAKYIINLNFSTMVFLAFLIPTAVEYLSALLIKFRWDILYWDYSNIKLNLQGFICLPFSIAWCILCLIGVYLLQTPLNIFFVTTSMFWQLFSWPIAIYFILDFLFTLKRLEAVS